MTDVSTAAGGDATPETAAAPPPLHLINVVAEAGVEPHAVHMNSAVDGDGVLTRVDELVALAEMVPHRRLVEHVGDDAVQLRAERVVRRLVCEAAGREHGHAERRVVRRACHVVQRPRVRIVQGAYRRVRGNAGVSGCTKDIAWSAHDHRCDGSSEHETEGAHCAAKAGNVRVECWSMPLRAARCAGRARRGCERRAKVDCDAQRHVAAQSRLWKGVQPATAGAEVSRSTSCHADLSSPMRHQADNF